MKGVKGATRARYITYPLSYREVHEISRDLVEILPSQAERPSYDNP